MLLQHKMIHVYSLRVFYDGGGHSEGIGLPPRTIPLDPFPPRGARAAVIVDQRPSSDPGRVKHRPLRRRRRADARTTRRHRRPYTGGTTPRPSSSAPACSHIAPPPCQGCQGRQQAAEAAGAAEAAEATSEAAEAATRAQRRLE